MRFCDFCGRAEGGFGILSVNAANFIPQGNAVLRLGCAEV